MHRTNISVKASTNTTIGDLDSPLFPKDRIMPKLAKIVNKPSSKPQQTQLTVFKDKFRSLKKTPYHHSESRISSRDEEQIFGDTNLRTEVSLASPKRKNKIHSLFIETHF